MRVNAANLRQPLKPVGWAAALLALAFGIAYAADDSEQAHWAFRQVRRPSIPRPADADWCRTPIDRFIRKRQEDAVISPAPPASKPELIRRATFDLIGLPPTRDEVETFLADDSADAYERLIDRLLASPRYGERWGRHWLDLARYADSNGFEQDEDRPHAYRYRDYVIRSFNADLPYDRFLKEQLAGDEIAPYDSAALCATGFCRNGPEVANQRSEAIRLDELDDVLTTTSSVFLGLTIGCARCHDHKHDPISQQDYYRMLAIWGGIEKRNVELASPRERARHIVRTAELESQIDRLREELAELKETSSKNTESNDIGADQTAPAKGRRELETRIQSLRDRLPQLPIAMAIQDVGPTARPTFLLFRGDPKQRGPEVEPGVPAALAPVPPSFPTTSPGAISTGRRTRLAQWMASPDNPLTARVIVNRVWQWHFGTGIVETSSDFGAAGAAPSHPELLDWLASEFVAGGWRLKPLHKLIMSSAVYRQSSAFAPDRAARDPRNRLLWRVTPRRLEAEEIRDSLLTASGQLNPQMFGPGIKPRIDPAIIASGSTRKWPLVTEETPEHWRRSVYVFIKRSVPLPLLEAFDAPAPNESCARRTSAIVPTQALLLANDPFTQEQATAMARRILRVSASALSEQVERAYWFGLSRAPSESERALAAEFLLERQRAYGKETAAATAAERALTDLCHVLFESNEFVFVN